MRASREIKDQQIAEELKTRLEGVHIAVQVRVGEEGKMFGAVTSQDIFDHISNEGLEVERKKILVPAPIKTLGKHNIQIKLHPEVVVDFEFEVVPLHVDEE